MSKADAQRAMREARYARNNASGPTRREAAAAAAAGAPADPTAAAPDAAPNPAPAEQTTRPARGSTSARAKTGAPAAADVPGERCGHKSMNGRACTREAAHPEKSHRYS